MRDWSHFGTPPAGWGSWTSSAHIAALSFLGRNEEDGLRCVYHGWKFDTAGNCLDMLNLPSDTTFKTKIHLKSYPTVEHGGIVWAYMGAPEKRPALPLFEWTQLPETHRFVQKAWEECNWLQAMEGGIDAGHAPILHRAINPNTEQPGGFRGMRTSRGFETTEEVEPTEHGVMSARLSRTSDNRVWVRINQYVIPFHTFFPAEIYDPKSEGSIAYKPFINGHIFVPMDDENTMTYNWIGRFAGGPFSAAEIEGHERSKGRGPGELMANFRKLRNKDKDWLIDRKIQRTETYTGIAGNHNQDHAVQESMDESLTARGNTYATPISKSLWRANFCWRRSEACRRATILPGYSHPITLCGRRSASSRMESDGANR